jgi:hypothetical protein
MSFDTLVSITLKPHFCNNWPSVIVGVNDFILYDGLLEDTKTFNYENILSSDQNILWIEFKDKTNNDTTENSDQAIEILEVKFENISTDRMIWAGKYMPQYPEPWASEQKSAGNLLEPVLFNSTYLGWNGRWELNFSVPIFTWIHKLENLGWIYD